MLSQPREQGFGDFSTPLKLIMEDAVGELLKETEDGFVNGQDDFWRWVDYNLNEYNADSAPPNMAMMAKMKSQQQLNMLKQMH